MDEQFRLAEGAAVGVRPQGSSTNHLRDEVIAALERGDLAQAEALMHQGFGGMAAPEAAEWTQIRDVEAWPDAWLIAAVRGDLPNERALDVLVDRYWKRLFGRCHMLTLNPEEARDLAQEAWCRVLKARQRLKVDGNFPAYLISIATNLWRDSLRFEKRAGPMAPRRLAALDASLPNGEEELVPLADVVPDLNSIQGEEQTLLKMDIDRALERLTPLLRDVLVARYINGESCQEIGRRYDRTEQTISGWVREAIREVRTHFEESGSPAIPK